MLNENDLKQLAQKGITGEKLNWQLSVFNKGIAYVNLSRPAIVGDGVLKFENKDIEKYISLYEESRLVSKLKFVPASGAASRMFKVLFEYMDKTPGEDAADKAVQHFIDNIEKFAFYDDIENALNSKGHTIRQLKEQGNFLPIIQALLPEEGLGYGSLPKGLLKFHRYEDRARTPFEEHLYEGAHYAVTPEKPVNLHFTVSSEHIENFKVLSKQVVSGFEKAFGISYSISFSVQKPSTDTLAVDLGNQPFRNNDGSMLFRPGGHGALLDNLNDLEADIIFIKNIDNVVPVKYFEPTLIYKKALAGKLVELRNQVYGLLEELENKLLTTKRAEEMVTIISKDFYYQPGSVPDLTDLVSTKKFLFEILNRPIRVCGVVKNLGEPGGGPFWAPNSKGDISLQIIESSQVDHDSKIQSDIFKSATHFNPVDLVCCPYDYKGQKFNLQEFVDESTCFISQKSKDGKKLKALELPGLWNGSMADWLTIFVEVPVETFNPVKTVNDLLRPQHQ